MSKVNMENWGFSDRFAAEAALFPALYVGRVCAQYRGGYRVMCENGEVAAEVSGKFRYAAHSTTVYPAVGDFVLLDSATDALGQALICHVLARRSAFIRKAAGTAHEEQVVASNMDTVFICMSLNNDFNPRRLERYLAIAWDSGAAPVIVLTKSDLCASIEQYLREAAAVAVGVEIVVASSLDRNGYDQVKSHITAGRTAAFIGSSGVGKSTLINLLLGEDRLHTQAIGHDDKGKHTTTKRELILLPGGGLVIDTPGMRELGLESADLSRTFADIGELAAGCKFPDCTHGTEPGCAVQMAIAEGFLDPGRLAAYQKLQKEAKYAGLNSRQIEAEKIKDIFGGMGGLKNTRKFFKNNQKS